VRILLVEDHTDTRVVLSRLLTRLGYDVAAAENFRDALVLLSQLQFDVLLSDIGLPAGDGSNLAAEARTRHTVRKAIALTALATDDDRDEDCAPDSPLPDQASILLACVRCWQRHRADRQQRRRAAHTRPSGAAKAFTFQKVSL
jgi:CheY-like chemotaxis protein